MRPQSLPRHHERRPAFSLVLSLTVMAMLLLLCIGVAALMAVELRVAGAAVSKSRARLNALAGARIALGELQRLVGPDQRATAQADILTKPDESLAKPADPTQNAAYDSDKNGVVTHPRWVGVWNTGVTGGEAVLKRDTAEGYLTDTRFTNGADWAAARASKTVANASPRLLGWLVSGSEASPVSGSANGATSITPFDAIDKNEVEILGKGTLGSNYNASNTNSDALGLRARRVPIPADAETAATASSPDSYAYGIFDENLKARVNLADPFEGTQPDTGSPGNGGYARLLIPQRHRFEGMTTKPIPSAPDIPAKLTDAAVGIIPGDFGELAALNGATLTLDDTTRLQAAYFHDLSFTASGLQTDMVNGGLKRDLTPFLQRTGSTVEIGGVEGVEKTGLKDTDPILSDGNAQINDDTLAGFSPRFGLLRNWWLTKGTSPLKFSETAPLVAPTGRNTTFNMRPTPHGSGHNTNPPQTLQYRQLPDLANQTKGSLAPQLTECLLFFSPKLEVPTSGSTSGFSRVQVRARVSLWNPYSVPLNLTGLTVDYGCAPYFWSSCSPGWGSNVHSRPWIRFTVPDNLVLKAGQSVVLVVDGKKAPAPIDESSKSMIFAPRDGDTPGRQSIPLVALAPSTAPGANQFYLDTAIASWGAITASGIPSSWYLPSSNLNLTMSFGLTTGEADMKKGFDDTQYNLHRVLLSAKDTGADAASAAPVYREINLNPYYPSSAEFSDGTLTASTGQLIYRPASFANGGRFVINPITSEVMDPKGSDSIGEGLQRDPFPLLHYGFRMKFFDGTDSETTDTAQGSSGGAQSLQFAPIADLNPLSARITRTPFDAISRVAQRNIYFGSLWTSPDKAFYSGDPGVPDEGVSPNKFTPFFNGTTASAPDYPGVIIRDVPLEETGVLSLGQFRHAPLNNLPYGPTLSFGSSHIPIPDGGSEDSLTIRTGLKAVTAKAWWQKLDEKWVFSNPEKKPSQILRQLANLSAPTANQQDIYDIAFEQNHALWDAFWVSGIPYAETNRNSGWTQNRWAGLGRTGADRAKDMPNGRLEEGESDAFLAKPLANGGAPLHRAAATLRVAGTFNVNSTSFVAWRSLLNAFRGIKVPTRDTPGGVGANDVSPFPRVLRPKAGDARGLGFKEAATWSGFRTLKDDELDILALKIVNEVKLRGPFLSLADFVNRRLKSPDADLAQWEANEKNYLGALDAAILASSLNKQYDDVKVDRGRKDVQNGVDPADIVPIKPEFKSRHKAAGTPGYLEQGDLLQPLGAILTARSDTFTIRAIGEHDGAAAVVEMTVRRTAAPVYPATAPDGISLNPKASKETRSLGNQLFGRKLAITTTRWMQPESR